MNPEEKPHRLMIEWLELATAISKFRQSHKLNKRSHVVPWECPDGEVRQAWTKLTAPENLHPLKEWLNVASSEDTRFQTRKAIEECERRKQGS